jgi:hypothetical protein
MVNNNLLDVIQAFRFVGKTVDVRPWERGRINATYFVSCKPRKGETHRYLLQRINTAVFRAPEQLMENIACVTAHIREKVLASGGNLVRDQLTLIETLRGALYHLDTNGDYWRALRFIERAKTYPTALGREHVHQVAKAFGRFLSMLSDLSPNILCETIPGFHDTPRRYEALMEEVKRDPRNRAHTACREIRFVEERASEVSALTDRLNRGELPLRTTHNDTKISNVLIDDQNEKGVCVIDLDTVMPGTALYDFGDLVRSACNPPGEETQDLSLVSVNLEWFGHCVRGYLEEVGDLLTPLEIELLPFSAKLIALELGMRFLTDYLTGDTYFAAKRPPHNLDRCRVQFKLVEAIEGKFKRMEEIVAENRFSGRQ